MEASRPLSDDGVFVLFLFCFVLFFTSVIVVSTVITAFSGCVLRLQSIGVSEGFYTGFESKRTVKKDSKFLA